MAILPRYQRIGLKTRQPQQMDFAAAREQARLGQNLSQQLDRMSDFAFKQAAAEAETRGQEAVREEGALPTLTALREAGGPTNIEERAAFDAANRIAVVEIESLAKQDYQNLVRKADKDDMPMSVFQESIAAIQDGYAASLQEVDPVAAGVLSARLSDSAMTYQGRYSDIATRKATVAASERVKEITEVGVQEIVDMALSETFNETNIEIAAGNLVNDLVALGVKEKNAQKVADSALSKAVRENRIYTYDNASSINTKKSLLELYEKRPLPGATYEANLAFNTKLENSLNKEITRAQNVAAKDLTEAIDAMALTLQPPPGFKIDEEYIRSIYPKEQAEQYIESWSDASEDAANRGALNSMSIDRALEIASELEKEFDNAKADGSPTDIINAKARENFWIETINKRSDALNKDAAAFVVGTDEVAAGIVNNINESIEGSDLSGLSENLLLLQDFMEKRFDEIDLPQNLRTVMPKQMAARLASVVENFDSDVATVYFSAIQEGLEDYAPKFIQELRSAGLNPEYIQAMYTDNVVVQKELVDLSKLTMEELLVGQPSTTKSDVDAEIVAALEDYRVAYLTGGDEVGSQIFNEQFDTVEKLSISRLKTGGSVAEVVEGVIQDLIPEVSQTIINSSGIYVVPMEFDEQVIDKNVSMLMDIDIMKQLPFVELDTEEFPEFINREVAAASLSSTGKFLNNSTGDGLSLHYVTNKGMLPAGFEVKFLELPEMVSDLYKKTPEGLRVFEESMGYSQESQKFIDEYNK